MHCKEEPYMLSFKLLFGVYAAGAEGVGVRLGESILRRGSTAALAVGGHHDSEELMEEVVVRRRRGRRWSCKDV